uniref:Uncharacterized protein n=1 Tax=Arion vulgaris TaxID=1028688 RepID=A0A0B6Z8U1_9EUPU
MMTSQSYRKYHCAHPVVPPGSESNGHFTRAPGGHFSLPLEAKIRKEKEKKCYSKTTFF